MIVEQIWTANDYRNFNYVIACPDTGEALAIDPLGYETCMARAKQRGFEYQSAAERGSGSISVQVVRSFIRRRVVLRGGDRVSRGRTSGV